MNQINKIILYSTHCPKCNILKKKLLDKDVIFEEVNDVELMTHKGFLQAPMLEVDGIIFNFSEANKWINSIDTAR